MERERERERSASLVHPASAVSPALICCRSTVLHTCACEHEECSQTHGHSVAVWRQVVSAGERERGEAVDRESECESVSESREKEGGRREEAAASKAASKQEQESIAG